MPLLIPLRQSAIRYRRTQQRRQHTLASRFNALGYRNFSFALRAAPQNPSLANTYAQDHQYVSNPRLPNCPLFAYRRRRIVARQTSLAKPKSSSSPTHLLNHHLRLSLGLRHPLSLRADSLTFCCFCLRPCPCPCASAQGPSHRNFYIRFHQSRRTSFVALLLEIFGGKSFSMSLGLTALVHEEKCATISKHFLPLKTESTGRGLAVGRDTALGADLIEFSRGFACGFCCRLFSCGFCCGFSCGFSCGFCRWFSCGFACGFSRGLACARCLAFACGLCCGLGGAFCCAFARAFCCALGGAFARGLGGAFRHGFRAWLLRRLLL